MKKLVFTAGLLSTVSITIGLVLRATLGTNASGDLNKILLGIGFVGLAVIFVPGMLLSRSVPSKSPAEKTCLKVLMVSLIPLTIGWIFKIFHVTSANELVLLGTSIFIFGFLPLVFIKMYRESIAA